MGCNSDKLSHNLLDLGFTCVFGTIEYAGMSPSFVGKGEPLRFDTNNGTAVVYDEVGRPWIAKLDDDAFRRDVYDEIGSFRSMLHRHNVQRGAFVPHSNDGGYYTRELLAKLEAGEKGIKVPDFNVRA